MRLHRLRGRGRGYNDTCPGAVTAGREHATESDRETRRSRVRARVWETAAARVAPDTETINPSR